ncbi:hypothetical protein M422DRAFT_152897 [Sphaerobolus stellatus SS14]|nr:hypothetical protein M422DRAFT_152897 [Sphaerobolus stellatus SS14]
MRVEGRTIMFTISKSPPRTDVLNEIRLMPYRDPQAIQEMQERLANLSEQVSLDDVQYGWHCRDSVISVEWQWTDLNHGTDLLNLTFREESRELIIQNVPMEGQPIYMIRIRYSGIQTVELDSKSKSILFILDSPPSLEQAESMDLNLLADIFELPRSEAKRKKLSYLPGDHEVISPYTWAALRIVCRSLTDLAEFRRMAETVNLYIQDGSRTIERRRLFAPAQLRKLQCWLASVEFLVGFQCEGLHRALLIDTIELLDLRARIESLCAIRGVEHTVEILRRFRLRLRDIWTREEALTAGLHTALQTDDRLFNCHHVIFTPTGMELKGPFPDSSNRILRRYSDDPEAFLRVSFTDESGLKFRFDRREVDGPEFIQRRIGGILKKGFSICGRKFEFLAYSQSALKEYTVWFCSPFVDRRGRTINARTIRSSIGSRWPPDLMRCPARFAARLSQAFTATDSSIVIEPDQIERISDINRNGYCFSDGNGLASSSMFNAILNTRRDGRRPAGSKRTTSVVQVRIQGAKGVINKDPSLPDFVLQLRESMVKFEANNHHDVEIARFFDKPVNFFLNRPLVMILAGLGVPHDVFLVLQRKAIKETNDSIQSLAGAAGLLETHGMGASFALPSIFQSLAKLGLTIGTGDSDSSRYLEDPFLQRTLKIATHHVLREIRHRSRIPVRGCWKLVGIVDTYNVLEQNEIYACIIRGEKGKREYLKGRIMVSKSPTIHPGDVQIVRAIGEPPAGAGMHFRELVNCVVFSQKGNRPVPNMLSGSDLDGDEYDLVPLESLHPPRLELPGEYDAAPRRELDRNSTIDDVADFVVDFINNDMLGIVATNFLLIADRNGIFHQDCKRLAELHSWAVDFPKNGVPVPFREIPQPDIRVKPDWYAPEIRFNEAQYYESQSVLGKLFRDIRLPPLPVVVHNSQSNQRRRQRQTDLSLEDAMQALSLQTQRFDDPISTPMLGLFDRFAAEMEHICYSYTLSRRPGAHLTEEEVFTGTIIANTTQPRLRRDKIASMRDEATTLARRIGKELEGDEDSSYQDWANRAWTAWKVSLMKSGLFGSKSFGFVALRSIFDAMKDLEELPLVL